MLGPLKMPKTDENGWIRTRCSKLIGYINTREKIRYLFTCVVRAFLRAGNPCITPQLM